MALKRGANSPTQQLGCAPPKWDLSPFSAAPYPVKYIQKARRDIITADLINSCGSRI